MRYSGWHRKKGDASAPPFLREEAKKLLGQLANTHALTGHKHLVATTTYPDGSVVRAQLSHGVATAHFTLGEAGQKKGDFEVFEGLVVWPKQFGNTDAADIHYADKPQVILAHSGEDATEAWHPAFYDATVPDGSFTGSASYYKAEFPDGIVLPSTPRHYSGYLTDWRNGDESLSVCWSGMASRYLAGFAGHSAIWFNGQVLYDAGADNLVLGAALHGADKLTLLAAIWVDADQEIHFITAPIVPVGLIDINIPARYAPRAKLLESGDITVALVRPAAYYAGFDAFTPYHFNQKATECRSMSHEYNSGTGHLDVKEVVVDWSDLTSVTSSEALHAEVYVTTHTTITYDLVRINATEDVSASATIVHTGDGSFSVDNTAAGDGVSTFSSWTGDTDLYPLGSSGVKDFLPLTSEYTRDIAGSVSEYKFAVDYRNNVPVYAFHVLPAKTKTASISASETYVSTANASASATYSGGGQTAGDSANGTTLDATTDGTFTASETGSAGGIRCPRTDNPMDGDWLSLDTPLTRTNDRSVTSVLAQAIHNTADTYPGIGVTTDASGSYDYTHTRDDEVDVTTLTVLHLDLRNRSAAYVLKQAVSSSTETKSATGSDSDTNTSSDTSAAYPTITKSGSRSESLDATYTTGVVFNDTSELSLTSLVSSSSSPAGDSGTFVLDATWGLKSLEYLCGSGLPIPVLTDNTLYSAVFPGTIDLQTTAYPDLNAGTDGTADNVDDTADGNETTIDFSQDTAAAIPFDVATKDAHFVEYRGGWAMSLPEISGTPYAPAAWYQQISNGDFDALTGSHAADKIINFWVMSAYAVRVNGSLTTGN